MPIPPILPDFLVNGPNWQCCLAGSFKTASGILIFSILMGANYLFYMKTIDTHARTFLALDILALGRVKKVPTKIPNNLVGQLA